MWNRKNVPEKFLTSKKNSVDNLFQSPHCGRSFYLCTLPLPPTPYPSPSVRTGMFVCLSCVSVTPSLSPSFPAPFPLPSPFSAHSFFPCLLNFWEVDPIRFTRKSSNSQEKRPAGATKWWRQGPPQTMWEGHGMGHPCYCTACPAASKTVKLSSWEVKPLRKIIHREHRIR